MYTVLEGYIYLFVLHYWRVQIQHTEQSENKQHIVPNIEKDNQT